jgi:hypothetical protein
MGPTFNYIGPQSVIYQSMSIPNSVNVRKLPAMVAQKSPALSIGKPKNLAQFMVAPSSYMPPKVFLGDSLASKVCG